MTRKRAAIQTTALVPLLAILLCSTARGYSVLSHEAIVDSAWSTNIREMLLKRYPTATREQLREAHAYAYGGCIIQDMGYYPFGSRFFSNLTHYVRSGDFVAALLEESRDMYEYAFALGALAHYAADNVGHPEAVNKSVPIIYPKLRMKYGDVVTFAEDPKAHVLVEFSFDVVQIAGAGYVPETYHNFIGFRVSRSLLDRAFKKTYGLELKDLFDSEDLAIGTYRRGASEVIPQMTEIAWKKKKAEIRKLKPDTTRKEFVYKLSRADYESEWGTAYHRLPYLHRRWWRQKAEPGLVARMLIFLFRIFPKVGALQTLSFRLPTPEMERMFIASFNATAKSYRTELANLESGHPDLRNDDFDTGKPTQAGEYALADETYAELLDRLAEVRFAGVTPELRENLLAFYTNVSRPKVAPHDSGRWQKIQRELESLKTVPILVTGVADK